MPAEEGRPPARRTLTRVLLAAWGLAALAYMLRPHLADSSLYTLQQQGSFMRLAGLQPLPWAASGGSSSTDARVPIRSKVGCDEVKNKVSARELDSQQQRRCALAAAGGSPPGGYVAACLAVRNQHRDLAEWLDWHARLGVARFYLMDAGSDPPLDDLLAPYVQAGLVVHRLMDNTTQVSADLSEAACNGYAPQQTQLMAYSTCLHDYGAQHQWMAFIDADEFIVPAAGTPPDLPAVLRGYEQYGGVGLNWRMFGSGGHKERQNSTLRAFTKCYPQEEFENRHIKTIGNMAFMTRTVGPHHAIYAPGHYAVTPNGQRVDSPHSAKADWTGMVLHHYVNKSWADYQDKMERGSGMGNHKPAKFFHRVNASATRNCTMAADMLERWRQEGSADG